MNPSHRGPHLEPDILTTRSLKRSREAENFDLILRKLEDDYALPLWSEAQQIGPTGWSPSRRTHQHDAARCLIVMRQVFWRNPDAFGQVLELFEQMPSAKQNMHTLVSLMEAQSSSTISPPKKVSPDKSSSSKATHNSDPAPELVWKYRTSSEVTTVMTSITSSRSASGGSVATSFTTIEASRPTTTSKHNTHGLQRQRVVDKVDKLPEGSPDDFDTELVLTQHGTGQTDASEDDRWLRRLSSPEMEEAAAMFKQLRHDNHHESPPSPLIQPEWFSAWPLQTQLTQDGSASPPKNDILAHRGGTYVEEFVAQDDQAPANEHYHLRDLAQQGLFVANIRYVHDLAASSPASPSVVFECSRIAMVSEKNAELMMSNILSIFSDDTSFWTTVNALRPQGLRIPPLPARSTWAAAGAHSQFVIRTGRLVYSGSKGVALFQMTLDPLQVQRTSNRFFRQFGSHRFLRLLVPSLRWPPAYLRASRAAFHERIQEWLNTPDKEFMGYKWSVFHTRPRKGKKARSRRSDEEDDGYEVMLFATEGADLETMTVSQLIDWYMPLKLNLKQPSCKAFARLELGLSKTYATVIFRPSQLRWMTDIRANGEHEPLHYRDKALSETCVSDFHASDHPRIMNDGCATISYAAANQIWIMLGEQGRCPSVMQARLGSCKGLWVVSDPMADNADEVWVEATDSQKKFEVHREDLGDGTFVSNRLTFEVISWSRKPSKSCLYFEFLPILEHRGVPRVVLQSLIKKSLDDEREVIEQAMSSRDLLYKWVQENWSFEDEAERVTETEPRPSEKVLKMLAAGFEPSSLYLSSVLKSLKNNHYMRLSSSLNIALAESTSLYGVADPLGCLAPNEIHLGFSSHFEDELCPYLHEVEALVARHPALRPSDIQKVKVVYKLELRHLVDVVVFPTRGTFPLAGKLQGGDYDGDKFWVCWQQDLVKPFRNAPVPCETDLTPEALGISIDHTKLGEVIGSEASNDIRPFLQKGFNFQWQASLLGISTNYFQDFCYSLNTIDGPAHRRFASLHDFLVDSSKNGYTFTEDDWKVFKAKHADPKVKIVSPAYKAAPNMPLVDSQGKPVHVKYNKNNIIDYLVFEVARPKALSFLQNETPKSTGVADADDALKNFFFEALQNKDPVVADMTRRLRTNRDTIIKTYKDRVTFAHKGKHDKREELLDTARAQLAAEYKALQPATPESPIVKAWLQRPTPSAPCLWDLLKASAAAAIDVHIAWTVASDHICYLKAHLRDGKPDSTRTPALVVPELLSVLKVKKRRGNLSKTESTQSVEEGNSVEEGYGSVVNEIERNVPNWKAADDSDVEMYDEWHDAEGSPVKR